MNIHEYQGKSILKEFGVGTQEGIVAESPKAAVEAAKQIKAQTGSEWFIIKAQIHAGGRGKGGGVKLAKSLLEVEQISDRIIGMNLVTPQTSKEGKLVRKILIAEDVYYPGETEPSEIYMSILLDREKGRDVLIYSTEGGMDIESVAHNTPELIFKEEIDPAVGLQAFQARRIAFNLKLQGLAFKNMTKFVSSLYKAFLGSDATLFEINPVLKTSDNKIIAVDSKVRLDDNALYRHPAYKAMRDISEEDPTEVEAKKVDLNFIKLDGNVGCMVNGAGLAMATMDIIKLSGGDPANFLDVGGTADAERVEKGFNIILLDPNVKVILVNIFGGIVRCDRVAQGIVDAYRNIEDIKVPIVVRLQGTNAKEGKEIIDKSGLKVFGAITLQDAADEVKKLLK